MLRRLSIFGCVTWWLIASCTTDDAARGGASQAEKPARLEVPAIAVHHVEAPGLNIDELTIRLRQAVDDSSGAPCIDETGVRAELAGCVEAPCPDRVARQYRDAAYIVDGSVSRVGDSMLATVRIQRGVEEVARATSSSADARVAITEAGAAAGTALRKVLITRGAGPLPLVDPTPAGPDATTGVPDPSEPRPDPTATERGD